MLAEVQQSIWDHFALKRGRFYLAGFLVGALGGFIVALKSGSHFWLPLAGGFLGIGAVGLIKLLERWQSRLAAARAQGQGTAWKSVFFVLGSLVALFVVALAFAGLVLLCTPQK